MDSHSREGGRAHSMSTRAFGFGQLLSMPSNQVDRQMDFVKHNENQ